MSTAVAFLELKRLLTGIESTSQRLKAEIQDVKLSKPFISVESDKFVDALESKVRSVQSRLDAMESNICGVVENRLSQVTMMEILQKCKTLHNANDEMIRIAERRMAAYGFDPISVGPNVDGQLDGIASFGKVEEGVRNMRLQPRDQDDLFPQDLSQKDDDIRGERVTFADETMDPSDISHINTENASYLSPAVTKTPQARGSEHEIKTPALPDWKLSEATRMLVLKGDGKDVLNTSRALQSTPNQYQNTDLDEYMIHTPDALDMTTMSIAQTGHYPNVSLFPPNIDHTDESGMQTPQPVKGSIYKSDTQISEGDSPLTPNIGTPFHTTNLREVVATSQSQSSTPGIPAETGRNVFSTVPENAAREEETAAVPRSQIESSAYISSLSSTVDSPLLTTPGPLRERERTQIGQGEGSRTLDFSSSPTDVLNLSPPKMAFMAPRPASTSADARPLLIPVVTDEEWESAPSFLRKQVRHYNLKPFLYSDFHFAKFNKLSH